MEPEDEDEDETVYGDCCDAGHNMIDCPTGGDCEEELWN